MMIFLSLTDLSPHLAPRIVSFVHLSIQQRRALANMSNHASEASEKRNHAASQSVSRYWSDGEHQLFLDALYHLGPSSNIAISKSIGTKSAKQVGIHKCIFLRDHANSLENARREVALSPSCPDTNPLPSPSDHSQSLPDTSSSPSNLQPSPPTAPLSNGTGYPERASSQTIH